MDIVHAGKMAWGENLAGHRAGSMAHKLLFEGDEGSPDNFLLALAKEGADYFSPRHKHAWDQVRFCLEGSVPVGKRLSLDAGEIGYFPEGVPYGPQEGGTDRIVLVLQMGGASGNGFLSAAQMRRARKELASEGKFEGGVFHRTGGAKKNEDAYEAIWQQATGKDIGYPKARYKTPILISPENFPWREAEGGTREKLIGFFPDRMLELRFIGIDPGSSTNLDAGSMRTFIFVRNGEGTCSGKAFFLHTAVRLEPGETCACAASSVSELLVISIAPVAAL